MKRFGVFVLFSFGCTIRALQFELPECDEGPPVCEGDVSVSCVDRKIVREECAPGVCDPAAGLCVDVICGDGVVAFTEQCDDSNVVAGDGCDDLCQTEPGFVCIGEPSVCAQTCGDGALDVGESCDDGNNINGDGCTDNCAQEVCGDGVDNNNNAEECDDGNADNTDACLDSCAIASCGDGFVQSGVEECDDGGVLSGDGCGALCVLEFCGDGIVNNNNEDCDDGGTTNGDGCDAQCVFEGDIFVLCDGGIGGNGSRANPLHSLQAGVDAATPGDIVSILPGSICGAAFVDQDLTIQGLRDEAGEAPQISADVIAVEVGGVGTQVFVQDLTIRATVNNGGININDQSTNVQLALIRLDVTNLSTGLNASAIDCTVLTGLATLLIDQAIIHDSPKGGVTMSGCEAIIANSLFANNGDGLINRSAIEVNATAFVEVFFSTFDGNQTLSSATNGSDQGTIIDLDGASTGKIDSSIFNNNNIDSDGGLDFLAGPVAVLFTDTFGAAVIGTSNINADPLFTSQAGFAFHLGAGSPARGSANPSPNATLFDPVAVFGVDPFSHDLFGNPRPAVGDMGCVEEP